MIVWLSLPQWAEEKNLFPEKYYDSIRLDSKNNESQAMELTLLRNEEQLKASEHKNRWGKWVDSED